MVYKGKNRKKSRSRRSRRSRRTRKLAETIPESVMKKITEYSGHIITRPIGSKPSNCVKCLSTSQWKTLKKNRDHASYCECRGKLGIGKQKWEECCDNEDNYL